MTSTCKNMDESHKHDFEWKKPDWKEHIKHDKLVPCVNLGQDLSKILRAEWPLKRVVLYIRTEFEKKLPCITN